jgi:Ger(x)C family germination protein
MKKLLLCLFLISSIFLNGCFSYRDINTVVFVTSVIFDIDKDNNPVIYLELFKPARSASKSSQKAERVVLKGKGKTAFEAMFNINLASSYAIDYTQNKAIIYTERAAKYGVNYFFDVFERDYNFVLRPCMAVYKGDVERLGNVTFGEEQFVGLFLRDLIDNSGSSSRTIESIIDDFIVRASGASKTTVLTEIKISDDEPQPTLVVDGGDIIKNGKMVENLPKSDGEAYNFLIDDVGNGSMEIADPKHPDKYISLRIENSKTKTKIDYSGKKMNVKKIINTKATVVETQEYLKLSDEEKKAVQKGAEENIISLCTNVFNKYKAKDLDIFKISNDAENKYGEDFISKHKNLIKDTVLEIEPHVFISSPGRSYEYKE